MKRIAIIIALLAAPAFGQSPGIIVVDKSRVPAGTRVIEVGTTTVNPQLIIPLKYNGVDFPAGKIVGWGPESILMAHATATAAIGTAGAAWPAIVKTEGYRDDPPPAEWQVGGDGRGPAMLQPHLCNLTLSGYMLNPYDITPVTDTPNLPDPNGNIGDTDLYDGYVGHGVGGIIDNVCFFNIPGRAFRIYRPTSDRDGTMRTHDRLKWVCTRVGVKRVFRGPAIEALDSYCSDFDIENFRDWGIKIGAENTGAVQFSRIHVYGGGYAGEPDSTGGAAFWLRGHNSQGVDCYGENAPIGFYFQGDYNTISGGYTHHCITGNVYFLGKGNKISQFRVGDNEPLGGKFVTAIGILNAGADTSITDSIIHPEATAIGLQIANGDHLTVSGLFVECNGTSAKCIEVGATTLNNCTIIAHCENGAEGFDCDGAGAAIGVGNYIWITTSGTTDAFDLPTGWTTTPTATTNHVYIDGTRYFPP